MINEDHAFNNFRSEQLRCNVRPVEAFEQIRLARVPPAEELLTPPFAALPAARAPAENNGRTLVIVAFERSPRSDHLGVER